MRLLNIDKFIVALILAVGFAFLWPEGGRDDGFLQWQYISQYGICGIFFLYGLSLAPERLKQGITRWKAHLLVIVTTFMLFPCVVLLMEAIAPGFLPEATKIGFFYVAALPSTVSSSVAMVSLARGHVPVAIFNATLSSLLGVFLTPLLVAWYQQSTGAPIPILPTMIKIILLVLLPIVLGQIARIWLANLAERYKSFIKIADRGIILAIVYGTFCNSVYNGLWENQDVFLLSVITVYAVLLFTIIYVLVRLLTALLKLPLDEQIAVLFCGSKKSLASGVPLAPIIFAGRPDIGLIIVPIMLFHFLQLILVSFLANNYEKKASNI